MIALVRCSSGGDCCKPFWRTECCNQASPFSAVCQSQKQTQHTQGKDLDAMRRQAMLHHGRRGAQTGRQGVSLGGCVCASRKESTRPQSATRFPGTSLQWALTSVHTEVRTLRHRPNFGWNQDFSHSSGVRRKGSMHNKGSTFVPSSCQAFEWNGLSVFSNW